MPAPFRYPPPDANGRVAESVLLGGAPVTARSPLRFSDTIRGQRHSQSPPPTTALLSHQRQYNVTKVTEAPVQEVT
ncbi:hypothetical protein GCM10022630_39410 [Thermobifida alba]